MNAPFRYLFIFAVTAVFAVMAEAQINLPPAAQKALDAGIAAAKAGDYPFAIKSLDEARKIAPEAPAIYFNLGLAESKIPGREVRAICALEAYLALSPDAQNAAAVRAAITNLETAARANVEKMIEVLKVGFAGLSTQPTYLTQPEASFPVLYLKLGRINDAEEILKATPRAKVYTSAADDGRYRMMKALIAMGRIDEAAKQVELMAGTDRGRAWYEMARAYIASGRFREAKTYLALLNNSDMSLLLDLAVAESKAGLTEDAEARFQDAKLVSLAKAKRMEETWWTTIDLPDFAFARWQMGQKDVAEQLLKQTLAEIETISAKSPYDAKAKCIRSYSATLENMGRHAEAVKIMDKAEKYWRESVRNNEEGYGIINEGSRISDHYRWLQEWKRVENFNIGRGVKTVFNDGMDGLKRWIATAQQEVAANTARQAATDTINKVVADGSAIPSQRAAMWMKYSDVFASQPIFTTDFNVMLRNLVDYTPPADDYDKPRTVFAHVEEPAEAIVDALNNIKAMRERKPIITNWASIF